MHDAREQLRTFLHDWGPLARVVLLLVAGLLLQRLARGVTARAAERIGSDDASADRRQRVVTLMSFALGWLRLGIWLSVILTILAELDVNLAPLLTGAGVLGAALAIGAQNVLKDYLGGFFILLENQYTLGDVVRIGAFTGTVEEVSMRATLLRSHDGSLHVIPNGTVQAVSNLTKSWARVLVDVPVPHQARIDEVIAALTEVGRAAYADEELKKRMLAEPEVTGVVAMTDASITLRLAVKVKAQEQWAVKNELLLRVKRAFEARGIELPPVVTASVVRLAGAA